MMGHLSNAAYVFFLCTASGWGRALGRCWDGVHVPPPPPHVCKSYALVQATVGIGTVLIWDLI